MRDYHGRSCRPANSFSGVDSKTDIENMESVLFILLQIFITNIVTPSYLLIYPLSLLSQLLTQLSCEGLKWIRVQQNCSRKNLNIWKIQKGFDHNNRLCLPLLV